MQLRPAPQAIICANAQVALGLLDELVILGKRIPEDVSVASVDDPLPASKFWPRLTVVEQPGYEMGRAAVRLMMARIDQKRPAAAKTVKFEARLHRLLLRRGFKALPNIAVTDMFDYLAHRVL